MALAPKSAAKIDCSSFLPVSEKPAFNFAFILHKIIYEETNMASGTTYTIYRTTKNTERIGFTDLGRGAVIKVWSARKDIKNLTWDDVPFIFPRRWLDPKNFDVCKVPNDEDDNPKTEFVRWTDGAVMERVGTWDFISDSVFLMDTVFASDIKRDIEITPYMATQFVQAVDFAEMYPMYRCGGAGQTLIGKMSETNDYIAALNSQELIPLPGMGVSKDDWEPNARDFIVRRVRAVLTTFLTLLSSTEATPFGGNPTEYSLVLSYWQ